MSSGLSTVYGIDTVADVIKSTFKKSKTYKLTTDVIPDSTEFAIAIENLTDLPLAPNYLNSLYMRYFGLNGGDTGNLIEDEIFVNLDKIVIGFESNSQTDKTMVIVPAMQARSYGEVLPPMMLKEYRKPISIKVSEKLFTLPSLPKNYYYPVVKKEVKIGALTLPDIYFFKLCDIYVTGEPFGMVNDATREITLKPTVFCSTVKYNNGTKPDIAMPYLIIESGYKLPSQILGFALNDVPQVKYGGPDIPFRVYGKITYVLIDTDVYKFMPGKIYSNGVPAIGYPITGSNSATGMVTYLPAYFRATKVSDGPDTGKHALTLHDTYYDAENNIHILTKSGLSTTTRVPQYIRNKTIFIPREDIQVSTGAVVSSHFFKYPKKDSKVFIAKKSTSSAPHVMPARRGRRPAGNNKQKNAEAGLPP